jgi:hypothetical protein
MWQPKDWIELVSAATPLVGVALLMVQRMITGKAVGARAIQMMTVLLVLPIILILGLEKYLSEATIGTMLGGVAGYVLSRVGEYQPSQGRPATED